MAGCYLQTPLWANPREWQKLCSHGGATKLHQLNTEIMDFFAAVSPTQEEKTARASAVDRLQRIAKLLWPSCEVRTFGSFATGLYLPSSDIDVVILLNPGHGSVKACLRVLADHLKSLKFAFNLKLINKARVPIVKFQERQTFISFDVSFECCLDSGTTHSGLRALEMTRQSLVEFPILGPLYMVLKAFMQQEKLNEVYQTGGMASYTLFVILKAFMQIYQGVSTTFARTPLQQSATSSQEYTIEDGLINSSRPSILSLSEITPGVLNNHEASASQSGNKKHRLTSPPLKSPESSSYPHIQYSLIAQAGLDRDTACAFLLLGFFHFYGVCLNSDKFGVSCAYGGSFFFKEHQGFHDSYRPYLLAVEDPLTPAWDIGKNSFNYQGIQDAFVDAYECLLLTHDVPNLLHCIIPLAKKWAALKG